MTDSTFQTNISYSPDPVENSAFYHPQSLIEETVRSFSYTGEDKLPVSISRNDIATENDGGVTNILNNDISNHHEIPFMPVDVEETDDYNFNIAHYVLRLYGPLINGQKAVVTITGIKVFFDIRVPHNKDKKYLRLKLANCLEVERTTMEKLLIRITSILNI